MATDFKFVQYLSIFQFQWTNKLMTTRLDILIFANAAVNVCIFFFLQKVVFLNNMCCALRFKLNYDNL